MNPRHRDRIAAVHHPGEARIDGDHAFAGYVAPAAGQAFAQIFGQRIAHEPVKVEAGQGEGHGLRQRDQCTNRATTSR